MADEFDDLTDEEKDLLKLFARRDELIGGTGAPPLDDTPEESDAEKLWRELELINPRNFEEVRAKQDSDPQFKPVGAGSYSELFDSPRHQVDDTSVESDVLAPTVLVQSRNRFRYAFGAVATVLGVAILIQSYFGIPTEYQVAKGATEKVYLNDGSLIQLDSGSIGVIQEGWGVRTVDLKRGAAYFSVAKNPSKPFIVESGEVNVTVLGTAFSVYHKGEHSEVVVESGKVNVSKALSESSATIDVNLTKNEKITIYGDDKVEHKKDVVIKDEMSWKTGTLYFNEEPLANVITRMADYHDKSILIMSKSLRSLKISGSYDAKNIDVFIEALKEIKSIKVEKSESGAILLF